MKFDHLNCSRTVKCDQDAFDILYDTYQNRYDNGEKTVGNIREKVAILERDALNSGTRNF